MQSAALRILQGSEPFMQHPSMSIATFKGLQFVTNSLRNEYIKPSSNAIPLES